MKTNTKKKRTFFLLNVQQYDSKKIIKFKKNRIFHSIRPIQSALKAFNKECQKKTCHYIITITDRNKIYKYKVFRLKMVNPKEIIRNGKKILIRYKTKANSLN